MPTLAHPANVHTGMQSPKMKSTLDGDTNMKNSLGLNRREVLLSTAAMGAGLAFPALAQDAYPNRPLQMVLPIPPGGIVDIVARHVAERLKTALNQPVLVVNKPGGSYNIGVTTAAAAPADGYTILTMHIGVVAAQAAMHQFDLLESFTPVGMIGELPTTLTVAADSPFKSLKDLIDYGRANPGKINYSTPGLGTVEHLKSLEFERVAGFQATHIPYKGGPEMVMSLIQGLAHFSMLPNALAEPYVAKGQLRYLAGLSNERLESHPAVPTAREQGVNLDPMLSWMGFMVRKGTPAHAIEVLARETTKVMQSREIRERFVAMGVKPTFTRSPDEFGQRVRTELAWMNKIVKDTNLKVG